MLSPHLGPALSVALFLRMRRHIHSSSAWHTFSKGSWQDWADPVEATPVQLAEKGHAWLPFISGRQASQRFCGQGMTPLDGKTRSDLEPKVGFAVRTPDQQ